MDRSSSRDGLFENVTASFQVFLPPGAPVKNITFGFGGPGIIGYIDLGGQFGSGSFELVSDSRGSVPLLHGLLRNVRDRSPAG